MYQIEFRPEALDELKALRAFDRTRVLQAIERLKTAPEAVSRNQKPLQPGGDIPWDLPVWELRVEAHRVFYRVEKKRVVVVVLAIRKKGRKQTKEIL